MPEENIAMSEREPTPQHLDERRYARIGLATLALTFGALLGWAMLAPLSSAVVASGRIVVASDNKVVQHLDGGLVRSIAVRDGDRVQAGQLLLALDDVALQSRLRQIDEQLFSNRANIERLAAERDGEARLRWSPQLAATIADQAEELLATQQALFDSRRAALDAERRAQAGREEQIRTQIAAGSSVLHSQRERLALLEEEHKGLLRLRKNNAVSQSHVRDLEGRMVELRGNIATQEGENSRLAEALIESQSRADTRDQEFRADAIAQLRDLQSQQINLQAERRDTLDRLSRVEIRAPVAGKIKGLTVVTLGAVIKAGQALMEIVPDDRRFRIDARISPLDIDSVHAGLNAEVRMPVFDGSQTRPPLFAGVDDVSSDVYTDQATREAYFKASLDIDADSYNILAQERLQLVSGMPVDVIIRTGQRTLADYLVRPLRDMLARAFNEA